MKLTSWFSNTLGLPITGLTCLQSLAHEDHAIFKKVVRKAGLEPARLVRPADFKSAVSTIPPLAHILDGVWI